MGGEIHSSAVAFLLSQVDQSVFDVQLDEVNEAAAEGKDPAFGVHLDIASYGDMSSFFWAHSQAPPSGLIECNVAYGETQSSPDGFMTTLCTFCWRGDTLVDQAEAFTTWDFSVRHTVAGWI